MEVPLNEALAARRAEALYRSRRIAEGAQTVRRCIDGREYLNFCSNDYLGLAAEPALAEAFRTGVNEYGTGSGAAHLVNGHTRAHHELEAALAEFIGRPRALLFSTGYMANLAVTGALSGRGDAVFADRLNHASLLDAALLSGARLIRYGHCDADALKARLEGSEAPNRLVTTDAVFSMDGDSAPLAELAQIAAAHRAWLIADDAHGIGVLGPNGRGSIAAAALGLDEVPVLMGTLGKAFGTFGAFVAGSEVLIETLIQQARPYIYTTALPAALAVATLKALELVRAADDRREHLAALVQRFRDGARQLGLNLMPSATPIQPLLLGDAGQAVAASKALEDAGILVTAIRPPTVPKGSARLRITFSAAHREDDVDRLLDALEGIVPPAAAR
ncbi:MAG TPA: 8-amino-7-oxononanoate synthase [Gammaproteobacteria bacterium]|nr:8-amino-7-oxononanoate synthase [Gammaproteobacteria bacterium]HET7587909.1 8-amino-7-oxononanoate synthase [Gammaproteobacteria bacterium]